MIPWILGHRGASSHAPENTMASMSLALEHGADGVEYDVQLSGDGHAVVFHDSDLARTTGAKGAITDLSLGELENLSLGHHSQTSCRIPRLQSILERVGGIHNLEIKLPDHPFGNPYRQTLALASLRGFSPALRLGRISPSSAITSFDLPSLDMVCRLDPAVRFGPIVEDLQDWETLVAWNPPRPADVLSLSAELAPVVLGNRKALPRAVRSSHLWLWHVPELAPWQTARWHPEALIVNDPSTVRRRLGQGPDKR